MISESSIFIFADFTFDRREKTLRRASGEFVRMPPRTCDLLAYLVENAGRLLSKDELLEKVWAGAFVEESNLTHHIALLRKILREGENVRRFVETVPRRGYRFIAPVVPREKYEIVVTELARTQDVEQDVEEESELPKSTLIGRERELAVIKNLLRRKDTRILTLTGVGGTGKTSLARAVRRDLASEFEGGTEFVDLSGIFDPAMVLPMMAEALEISAAETDLNAAIRKRLAERKTLIVLDNFEQVLDAAPQIANALAAPSKILATSRERLRATGEREFSVPPLDLPVSGSLPEELAECSSVRLFVERGGDAQQGFRLTDENSPVVGEICRRLEGLPLAIELAAARLWLLSPRSILQRLENQLKVLGCGSRRLPDRHRTMRAAIEWSYDLLEEEEKKVFASLAVFASGFTVKAAEAVAAEAKSEKVGCAMEALDVIQSLADKNLLWRIEPEESEDPRFRFPEAIREFALERLKENGVNEDCQRRHAAYFFSLVENAEAQRHQDNPGDWARELECEHDNLRRALAFLLDTDPNAALELAGLLNVFWSTTGHFGEGRRWLDAALRKSAAAPPTHALGVALKGAALLAWKQGDYEAGKRFYEECMRVGEMLDDVLLRAMACNGLGTIAYLQGDFGAAKDFLRLARELNRFCGDRILNNSIVAGLGEIARLEGDFASARQHNEEVVRFARARSDYSLLSASLVNLAVAAFLEGDERTAQANYEEAARLSRAENLGGHLSLCLDGFAALAVRRGERERALSYACEAESLREEIGYALETPDRLFREKYLAEIEKEIVDGDFRTQAL